MSKIKITLGDSLVVSQAPPEVKHWGPWQFPIELNRMQDGGIHLIYHVSSDSCSSAGMEQPHAVSYDEGKTWKQVTAAPSPDGLVLPNGDRLKLKALRPIPADSLVLPECVFEIERVTQHLQFYRSEDMPDCLSWGFAAERLPKGESKWRLEKHCPKIPGLVRTVVRDVLENYPAGDDTDYLTMLGSDKMKLAPDGSIWQFAYLPQFAPNGQIYFQPMFLVSDQNGTCFEYRSHIAFCPDKTKDPFWAEREGFTEPDICFMPDGSIICIMRTQDHNGNGPSYVTRSIDNGYTWGNPQVFDEFGVWPVLLSLKNGITLLSYGRPGLFARVTDDPSGMDWEDAVTILEPEHGTCSYSSLLELDDNTVLLTYSDFSYPNPEGIPVKTILARTVHVQRP